VDEVADITIRLLTNIAAAQVAAVRKLSAFIDLSSI
jgi:hypothetical protein